MPGQLLQTKLLIPPLRPALVARKRLFQQLDQGLAQDLILVSAPAGYGKTTLLSAWGRGCGCPLAWLSLDAGDNDPARFLTYLAAALQSLHAGPGVGPFDFHPQAGERGASGRLEAQQTALLGQLEMLERECLLVLDDYHLITEAAIHRFMARLVEHRPPALHLAICTRADPPLPLARLRANARLVELRLEDLRFGDEEAAAFLNQVMGLDLQAGDVAALSGRTEGWVAGLQMAAISMRGRDDLAQFIRAFTGSHRYVLDYLAAEVLLRQPAVVQEFLIKTAILERMCAGLCAAVVRGERESALEAIDGQAVLEHLEANNLFVVALDDRREWYRYHRLFADLLRRRLLQAEPGQMPELHRRASRWLQRNGLEAEAVQHALAASDPALAAEQIEAAGSALLLRGEALTLQRWLEQLPEETILSRPHLDLIRAAMLILSGSPAQVVQAHLQRLSRQDVLAAELAALRSVLAIAQVDLEQAKSFSRQALAGLPEGSLFFRNTARWVLDVCHSGIDDMRQRAARLEEMVRKSRAAQGLVYEVVALCGLAEARFNQGRLAQAEEIYRQALERAKRPDGEPLPIAGQSWVGLGTVYQARDELAQAIDCHKKGIELTQAWRPFTAMEGYINLAICQQALGDEAEAQQMIRDARRLAESYDLSDFDDRLVELAQAQLDLRQGQSGTFWRYWAQHSQNGEAKLIDLRMRKYEQISFGWACLADGRPADALHALLALLPELQANDRGLLVLEIELLCALAWQSLGDAPAARQALGRALALAAESGAVRLFRDAGPALAPLLHSCAAGGPQAAFAAKLLAAIPGQVVNLPPVSALPSLVEPLSGRELEVLRLLRSSLTVPEMAAELYVAESTVRSHIKSIYGKLGVHRRIEAVQRAEALGLVDRQQGNPQDGG
jgi:LuxR family maltose regulon positive regulatory protein